MSFAATDTTKRYYHKNLYSNFLFFFMALYLTLSLSFTLSLSLSLPPRDNQGRTAADIACLKCSTGSEQLKSRIRDLINSETIFRVYCLKERA